ncbi:MAG: Amuc_1100 family pilus-like protein [Verrucomicrobiota bacterium]
MKENGFAIILGIVTLLIGGGLVAFGIMQGGAYQEALARYDEAKSQVQDHASSRPFPTKVNRDERKKEITAYRGRVEGLQNALLTFRPESLNNIAPSELQDRLVNKASELRALFDEKRMDYPEQFALGFEGYKDELADSNATGKLNYQLEAMDWLFRELVDSGGYEVINVRRESIPSEGGIDWVESLGNKPVPIAQSMPIELTFFADEESTQDFINRISSASEYFFAIDMIRVENAVDGPPVREQAGFEEEEAEEEADSGGGGGAFGDVFGDAFDDDEEEEEQPVVEEVATVDESRILGQILGGEALQVGLQLRLMLFTDGEEVAIPTFD